MFQVTLLAANGERYPVGWFANANDANLFADEKRVMISSVLVHEIQSAVLLGSLIPRSRFKVNGCDHV